MRTTKRRFYFHFRKCDKKMSVHFKGVCHVVDEVSCEVPCHTKRNKRQPYLVMQGVATNVCIGQLDDTRLIATIYDSPWRL